MKRRTFLTLLLGMIFSAMTSSVIASGGGGGADGSGGGSGGSNTRGNGSTGSASAVAGEPEALVRPRHPDPDQRARHRLRRPRRRSDTVRTTERVLSGGRATVTATATATRQGPPRSKIARSSLPPANPSPIPFPMDEHSPDGDGSPHSRALLGLRCCSPEAAAGQDSPVGTGQHTAKCAWRRLPAA